jgi:hypothetical protein
MPFTVASPANLCLAPAAAGRLASVLATYVRWFDPLTALSCWAVDAVSRRVLDKFAVPIPLERIVKQSLNVLEGNIVLCAALWRHLLGVVDGKPENALQARVAHAVTTFELRCLGRREFAQASHAIDTDDWLEPVSWVG